MPDIAIQFLAIVGLVMLGTCGALLYGFFAAFSNDFEIEE